MQGTKRVLACLQDFEVEQFLFTSSMLVYKPVAPGKKITETSPLSPEWGYPASKVDTEKLLFSEHGNIPVVNLRVAGVYSDHGNSIPIANQIQRIYEKQLTAYFYPGNPDHGSSFVHLNDLVIAMILSIKKRHELPPQLTLNIGEEELLSYKAIQQIISKQINGKEWKINRIPAALAKMGAFVQNLFGNNFIKPWMIDIADDHYELDSSKAEKMLEWKPQHRLSTTIPKMIERLKADPEEWYKKNGLKK